LPEGFTARRFGDYELLEELARGGMGIVYKARQISLDRLVAVKMLLFGQYSSKEFVHRFRIEASAAASLRHPNIVAIHEVGVHQEQHYFVMELVDGPDLARIVKEKPLPPAVAARYVESIAKAIHFAHERRILHRDLKPSNVLIDSSDQPRITDFGLAKRLADDSDLTVTGQVLGSPNFMPPEQASAQRGQIGPASDVYSMGAVLYHALTGRSPFVGETLADTLQQVLHKEPIGPRLLVPSIPADLETICLKCLEKEPGKRFQTAQELSDELGRFLRDEPIRARPITSLERGRRWCRRNPLLSISMGLVTLLLLLLGIGGPVAALRIARAQRSAEANLYLANIFRGNAALETRDLTRVREVLDAIEQSGPQRALRGWEWRFLADQARSDERLTLGHTQSWLSDLAASPDGRTLASIREDGVVQLWKPGERGEIAAWPAHANVLSFRPDWCRHAVVFSPDGTTLFTAGQDGAVRCWDLKSKKLIHTVSHLPYAVNRLAIARDGKLLAGQGEGQRAYVWRWSGTELELLESFEQDLWVPTGIGFSPDGKALLVGWVDQPIVRYDLEADDPGVAHPIVGTTGPFVFSDDGKWLVTAGPGRHIVQRWTWPSLAPLPPLKVEGGVADSFAISPDSEWLAAGLLGGQLNLWSLGKREPQETRVLLGHEDVIGTVVFVRSDGGVNLVSISQDNTIRQWEPLGSRRERSVIRLGAPVLAVAISPNASFLAAVVRNKVTEGQQAPPKMYSIQLWDLKSHLPAVSVPFGGKGLNPRVRFSPDGQQLGVSDFAEQAVYQIPSLELISGVGERGLVYTPDRQWFAYIEDRTIIKRTSLESPETVFATNRLGLQALAVSADGGILAASTETGPIQLYDTRTGAPFGHPMTNHTFRAPALAFTPDGSTLVSGGWDGRLGIWDVRNQRKLAFLRGHNNSINSAVISPDGGTIATCGDDSTVRLWSVTQRQEIALLQGHTATINDVAFSTDGEWLASASDDETVRLWHAPPALQAGQGY
jgi:WD40 repeat protein